MRIVLWNCAMGLHKKWDHLIKLEPDIAIVPECAEPSIVWARRKSVPECDTQWVGNSPHKGLGVFAFSGLSLERDTCFELTHKYFLPVRVSGRFNFTLLAVWAFGRRAPGQPGKRGLPTTLVLDHYLPLLSRGPAVVAGDFNNSTIWDRPRKVGNFANISSRLEAVGLRSTYHALTGAPYGEEPVPTLFWMKGKGEYHIDYCFLPVEWRVRSVIVGSRDDWMSLSDHAPIVVDCDFTDDQVIPAEGERM